MTDTAKSTILAAGITIAIGLTGVILRVLSPLLLAIVTGPGLLIHGLLGRNLPPGLLLWFIGAIPQFVFIYFICLWAFTRPPFWQLRIGLLAFIWLVAGYFGWGMVR